MTLQLSAQAPPYLVQVFADDPEVRLSLTTALATVLNVSIASVELNITASTYRRLNEGIENISFVLVEYLCSRDFLSLTLAREWAARVSPEELQALINEEPKLLQAKVLDFQLEISGLPVLPVLPVREPNQSALWIIAVVCLLLFLSVLVASRRYRRFCWKSKADLAEEASAAADLAEEGEANAAAGANAEAKLGRPLTHCFSCWCSGVFLFVAMTHFWALDAKHIRQDERT